MSRVSVIIPTRQEPYLKRTVEDLLAKAAGEVEVIVVLDGPDHFELQQNTRDKRIQLIDLPRPAGLRAAVNVGATLARGKYVMKIDAHCMMGEAWDEILKADCEDNQIVIPTRYWLDPEAWEICGDKRKVTAMYFSYPWLRPFQPKLTGVPWDERMAQTEGQEITEELAFQGSLYFMQRKHWIRLGERSAAGYGMFAGEPEEIGLKTQLGFDGQVIRNRKTWYAHWGKPNIYWIEAEQRGHVTMEALLAGYAYSVDYWLNNRWEERAHDFEWLVEKWWPLPGWPEDWRTRHLEVQKRYGV